MNAYFTRLVFGLTVAVWLPVAGAAETAKQPKPEAAPAKAAAETPGPAKPDAEPAKPDAAGTHTVKLRPLKITVDLDGVFEARSAGEVILRFDEYVPTPALKVVSAVKHGAQVKKGEVLLTLDPEKLDKQIDDLRTELKLSELGLQQAEDGLAVLEKTTPLDVAANERAGKVNQEDRKYYFDVQRPHDLKLAEFNLTRAKNYLE